MKLSIIIPTYNESLHISKNLEKFIKILDTVKVDYEIIVVEDGSQDNTYEEILKYKHKRIKAVGYDHNQGKGYAIQYGFNFVKGDIVAFIDADFDLYPGQIKNFIESIKDYDIVIGSKMHPLSKVDYPLKRKIISLGYQFFIKILFNLDIKDTQVGLKLFRYEVMKNILQKVSVKGYAFDLELIINAQEIGYRIIELPIELNYQCSSNINLKSIIQVFLDTLRIFYRLKILKYYER